MYGHYDELYVSPILLITIGIVIASTLAFVMVGPSTPKNNVVPLSTSFLPIAASIMFVHYFVILKHSQRR